MTNQERTAMYRTFLEEEGYRPRIDGDGDVFFKYEGRCYVIVVEETDEEFFRLIYPDFWGIESDSELAAVKEAALRATAETKVAKIFPVRDNTWATIELFCSPPETFKPIFHRCLSALRASVEKFVSQMQEASSLRSTPS
jgi:hypothetical protein